jgi:hypothetical protein
LETYVREPTTRRLHVADMGSLYGIVLRFASWLRDLQSVNDTWAAAGEHINGEVRLILPKEANMSSPRYFSRESHILGSLPHSATDP